MLINELGFLGKIIALYEYNESTPFYLLYDKKIPTVGYFGNYDSWDTAYKECKGYEDDNIINTVITAVNKVLDGDAAWERDGCLFYEQKYVYHICAAILKCALQNKNQGVRILDIGGSLGSTYYQNRDYLTDVNNLEYVVAEQGNFVDYGHKHLENGVLRFIRSTDNWNNYGRFDIILLSGGLQYIFPYEEIVTKIMKLKPRYIFLDRVLVGDRMRICKETVPEIIYKSSYPVTIFSEDILKKFFYSDYELVEKDISSVPEEVYFVDGKAVSMCYVFRNKLEDCDE